MNKKMCVTVILLLLFTINHASSQSKDTNELLESWRLDSRFSGLDLQQIIDDNYLNGSQYSETISHYSGYYNLNPFLLAEFVLAKYSKTELSVDSIASTAQFLSTSIHNKTIDKNGRSMRQAISQQLDMSVEKADTVFQKTQRKMKQYSLASASQVEEDAPMPLLDVPFEHNQKWFFNGVHTWNGSDDQGLPMSSIDIALTWGYRWGDDTSNDLVAAAHDGVATVYSSCFIRITHESGWATDYYHLDDIIISSGDTVKAGEVISSYANNLAQATCQGGSSSGPHLHFALVKDGERVSIDGVELSGWKIHAGNSSYDQNRNRMWLEKRGLRKFAYSGFIAHESGDNIVDYRYSGVYTSSDISGHGLNISITELPRANSDESRKVVFIAFYTYDDSGDPNFYVGNIDFDRWRADESVVLEIRQTQGGNFSDLMPINFQEDVELAGEMVIKFKDCSTLEVDFDLIEPDSREPIAQSLVLSKIVGTPSHVCEAASLPFVN